MLTYIVEDSPLKAGLIQGYLAERFPNLEIRLTGSYQTGLKLIQASPPKLILLDMTLPNFDRMPNAREGKLRPTGGYDMMRKIKLKGINTSIIVITQLESFGEGEDEVTFEEMTARCTREFPGIFQGSVYFDQRESAWQESLEQLIENIGDI